MPDKYFEVDGVATLVHHRGESTLPGAPPDLGNGYSLLLLHDAGTNGNSFRDVMDRLAVEHSPVSFDLPGHGRSGELDSLTSIEAMAVHAENLVGDWGLNSLIVVGEGMGAAVALELASRAVIKVAGVVCLGAVGRSVDLSQEISDLALIASGKARRQFDSTGYAPDTDESVFRKAFAEWVKTDPRAALGARRAQEMWNAEAEVSHVNTPTLVVIGEETEDQYRQSSERLADELPFGATRGLDGAARRGAIENPAELSLVIDAFSNELEVTK
ncbi:MAG: alpha/beta hydrolase [Actinomycetota bacterium]|nr:alpha/beta hydrolase [Actinomycetota bacterium]